MTAAPRPLKVLTARHIDEHRVEVLEDGKRLGVYPSLEWARRIIANAEQMDLAEWKREYRKMQKETRACC